MHLNCKTSFDKNAVTINFKRNMNSYKNVRDNSYYESKSSNAEKSLIIYVYQEISSEKTPNSSLNYSCLAKFDDLDVFPFTYSYQIGMFTHPVSEQSL